MPITHNIVIKLNGQTADVGDIKETGLYFSYSLEDPDNFQSKQGSFVLGLQLPATQINDRIFNTFYKPSR